MRCRTRVGGGSAIDDPPQDCVGGPRRWRCDVPDTSGSGDSSEYRVEMRDAHCWRAVKVRGASEGRVLPRRSSGCVSEDDQHDPGGSTSDY